ACRAGVMDACGGGEGVEAAEIERSIGLEFCEWRRHVTRFPSLFLLATDEHRCAQIAQIAQIKARTHFSLLSFVFPAGHGSAPAQPLSHVRGSERARRSFETLGR